MLQKRKAMLLAEGYVTTPDGVRLFFQTLGSGPKTVIVPNGFYLLEDFTRLASGRMMIVYDLRNRGRSDQVTDQAELKGVIHHDVDDLEAVRRHFGIGQVDLIGHSYVGITLILYAMRYAAHVNRVVQVGPMEPFPGKQYPAHLTGADDTLREVFARLAQMQTERGSGDPVEFCRKCWSVLNLVYVVNPADAEKLRWERCHLPNELNFMKYWTQSILPSLQSLNLSTAELAKVKTPVLTLHGTRDRSAPYGGGREWALLLPNAWLVTVQEAGHAPWIEGPEKVFGAIKTFLDGAWPQGAEKVESLDPVPFPGHVTD